MQWCCLASKRRREARGDGAAKRKLTNSLRIHNLQLKIQNSSYFQTNLTQKYIAFTSGSLCFNYIVHQECDFHSIWFLRNHYSNFLNSLKNKSCRIFWKGLECKPILMTLLEKLAEKADVEILLKLCEDLEVGAA